MRWEHRCSIEWMTARQSCLTASDVRELVPITATGKPRKITDETRLRVLARKMTMLTYDDCLSTGAAARGHMLEGYAVDAFNKAYGNHLARRMYHWDDKIVQSSHRFQSLGFSPDACDVDPWETEGTTVYGIAPKIIGEVKCYGAERHMLAGYSKPSKLEERWQIATAMATCPSIEEAFLILYNPSMRYRLFIHPYLRVQLEDEIEIVKEVERDWIKFVTDVFPAMDHGLVKMDCLPCEQDIVKEIEKREQLNP